MEEPRKAMTRPAAAKPRTTARCNGSEQHKAATADIGGFGPLFSGKGHMETKYISLDAMNDWMNQHGIYFGNTALERHHYILDTPLSQAFVEYGVSGEDNGLFCYIGKDNEFIHTGDAVFGEDGMAWNVIGIGGTDYPIIAVKAGQRTSDGRFQRLKPKWLTHERPARKPKDIAALMERFADENECPDRDTLRQWAKELKAND